jgi:hypothetical protein
VPTNSDDHFDEQFPLSPVDDYLIHQTPDPIRVAGTTDPRFFDRYWCVCHDDTGDLLLALGGSFYPNLDTAEAYAIVNYRGQHRSVRAFRRLGADRMDMRVGPFNPQILRGMREWRLVLEDNPWEISFDLNWRDTRRQIYHAAYGSLGKASRGRQRDVNAGFEGFGTAAGWIKVAGRRFDVAPESFHGTRDRHWGIGRGVGGPALQSGRPHRAGWIGGNWIEFSDFAIWGNTVLYKFGDPRPGMGTVVRTERRLRFEESTRIFSEGEIDYFLCDGSRKHVVFQRLGFQTAYMRCGMYGGTPEGNIFHGMYVGDDVVEGDCYDVTRPEIRGKLSGLNEHHCRITCDGQTTTGILQPLEPDAYEACLAGRPGWNFL